MINVLELRTELRKLAPTNLFKMASKQKDHFRPYLAARSAGDHRGYRWTDVARGTHCPTRLTTMDHVLFGSTAEKVVRKSLCPVLDHSAPRETL